MPYTESSTNLPSYVKNKPDSIKKKWISIFNSVFSKEGEEKAFLVANTWLKKEIQKTKFVKRSVIEFDIDSSGEFIKRSDNGDEYISLVLNTTDKHYDGRVFSEDLLKKWADYINKNPIVGDIDHSEYDKLLSGFHTDDFIKDELRKKSGIAKSIKAIYENGRLWVRAVIDKRYKKVLQEAREKNGKVGVSAEAFITRTDDTDTKVLNADLLGFTFNVKTKPADFGAAVI